MRKIDGTAPVDSRMKPFMRVTLTPTNPKAKSLI